MSSAYIPDENMPRERSRSSLFFAAIMGIIKNSPIQKYFREILLTDVWIHGTAKLEIIMACNYRPNYKPFLLTVFIHGFVMRKRLCKRVGLRILLYAGR